MNVREHSQKLRACRLLWSLAALLALAVAAPLATTAAAPPPSNQRVLGLIRSTFRSHRPPPPYVTYTIVRVQKTIDGYPDFPNSYTYEVWCRSTDRASLARKVFRFPDLGPLEFQRPAFNEARDPGPPTADLFEPAPAHPHTIDFVPTPEASGTPLPVIGTVTVSNEFDYRVESVTVEGNLVHLHIVPTRDPDRNRLREIWADRQTYELRKLVATDKLFTDDGKVYGVIFTVVLGSLEGRPVVTDIHGVVGDDYNGDGKTIDYHFKNIAFPASLPDWYFDPHQYRSHTADAPT